MPTYRVFVRRGCEVVWAGDPGPDGVVADPLPADQRSTYAANPDPRRAPLPIRTLELADNAAAKRLEAGYTPDGERSYIRVSRVDDWAERCRAAVPGAKDRGTRYVASLRLQCETTIDGKAVTVDCNVGAQYPVPDGRRVIQLRRELPQIVTLTDAQKALVEERHGEDVILEPVVEDGD